MNLHTRLTKLEAQQATGDAGLSAELKRIVHALPDDVLEAIVMETAERPMLEQVKAQIAPCVTPGLRTLAQRAAMKPIEDMSDAELCAVLAVGL